MPYEEKTEKYGVCRPVHFARVGQGLHEKMPIASMGGDLKAYTSYDCHILAF